MEGIELDFFETYLSAVEAVMEENNIDASPHSHLGEKGISTNKD